MINPHVNETWGLVIPSRTLFGFLRGVLRNRFVDQTVGAEIFACRLSLAAAVIGQTGTGRNETTDDDVFLQTTQFVALAHDGGFG